MAKKAMLEREIKRKSLISKYSKKRQLILEELKNLGALEIAEITKTSQS